MQDLDFSALNASMLVISMIFIVVIGSFFSLGLLRAFQQRVQSSIINFAAGVICIVIFVIVASAWSA